MTLLLVVLSDRTYIPVLSTHTELDVAHRQTYTNALAAHYSSDNTLTTYWKRLTYLAYVYACEIHIVQLCNAPRSLDGLFDYGIH